MAGSQRNEILLPSDELDSWESATPQLLRRLQIWNCWTKLIQVSLLRIPWTRKESVYSSELLSVCKNSRIFPWPLTMQVSSSWLLPSRDQSTLRVLKKLGEVSCHGKNDHGPFVTVCGTALWWRKVTMLKDRRILRIHVRNAKTLKRWCLC